MGQDFPRGVLAAQFLRSPNVVEIAAGERRSTAVWAQHLSAQFLSNSSCARFPLQPPSFTSYGGCVPKPHGWGADSNVERLGLGQWRAKRLFKKTR